MDKSICRESDGESYRESVGESGGESVGESGGEPGGESGGASVGESGGKNQEKKAKYPLKDIWTFFLNSLNFQVNGGRSR